MVSNPGGNLALNTVVPDPVPPLAVVITAANAPFPPVLVALYDTVCTPAVVIVKATPLPEAYALYVQFLYGDDIRAPSTYTLA